MYMDFTYLCPVGAVSQLTWKHSIFNAPDPQTKDWLTRNMDPVFGYPSVVRFSWATCSQLLEQSAVDFEWQAVLL